ncbi:MAG TPA: ADP-ribosylglycohydrolase family protein, partial [Thermomicrobiales bacterium]|nr:ADP-ribosylglycohydrolase family protein [Thermomicrobiales bacterium]
LGALLGLAIGDALGMPVAQQPGEAPPASRGPIDGYVPKRFADGVEIAAGEFTDESEIALCIVESMTVNGGAVDPDMIAPRLVHLANGESRRWLQPATRAALARAEATDEVQVPLDEDGPATGDVATRGVPIGLMHSVGQFRPDAFRADVEAVVRLTHGSPAAISATTAVAYAVRLAAIGAPPADWARETAAFVSGAIAERLSRLAAMIEAGTALDAIFAAIGTGIDATEAAPAALAAAIVAERFEDVVFAAVNAGGAADAIGAIAGAVAGARYGSAGIPQRLIDGLQGRIYVSLAAPWFWKAAQTRAGLRIDLTPIPPRPTTPPRF